MTIRLVRIAMIWVLLLATAWIAKPYVIALWGSDTEPRTVTSRANLAEAERTTIKLFQMASPLVAHVYAQQSGQGLSLLQGQARAVQSGSGIVWDADGHVITNFHVIRRTGQIGARLASGEFVAARVVGVAPNYDLAMLQFGRTRSHLHPIAVGSSADLQVGQAAFAIGSPYGLQQTLTSGIISALHRRLPTSTSYEIAGVIQTDAAIDPGNSGGPLLDSAGRLIGVNSAIISGSGASAGIGFAIPVDIVTKIAAQLIRNGHISTPGIGIVAAQEATAMQHGIDGVVILRTLPDSPAKRAGLEGVASTSGTVADVITAANGQAVHSMPDLAAVFEQVGVGKTVRLAVTRKGQSRTVDVPVADVSKYEQG